MRLQRIAPASLVSIALLTFTGVAARAKPEGPAPPTARVAPMALEKHGLVRQDDYYWLNERDNPEVLHYLEAENEYTRAMMAHTERLQGRLVREFRKRIKQTDTTVPYRLDDFEYYSRVVDGKEYPIHCRKAAAPGAPEQIMLDLNALAEGHGFLSVGSLRVSSAQDLLAYPVDTVGRRIYTIHFKNLVTGEELPDRIPAVTSNLAWANDNRTLFYTKQDPATLRWHQVWRHVVGGGASADQLVYEETDETFDVRVWKTRSQRYLMIGSFQTLSSELRYLDAGHPDGQFQVILPRQRDHEYEADHWRDHFYIRTNSGAKNFRLVRAPVGTASMDRWEEVIPHRDDVLLEDFEIFRDHLLVVERKNGLVQLRVRPWSGASEHYLDFGEPAYSALPKDNYEIDTNLLRYVYTSLTTPPSVYDYDMDKRQKTLLKRDEVAGGFDSADYLTERLYAMARDGTRVPISIVYRRDTARDGSHPLLLYGYGSYGASMDAEFNPYRVSLLDRGFIFALAHVRGGQELGRRWYEDGKLLKKKNTFGDFIDCAEYLVAEGYTRPERLYIEGGSAGGLLIGAVINMRPELFRGAIAKVPFVDVVTTMLDDSIPLTTGEYDEWGNPDDKRYFDYMLSYSPYDNVVARDYPALLVTTGLHDSQVQYFEPAKWVAKLRAMRTDDDPLLLKTEMEAGHGGRSGRYKRYEEIAFAYAFLLDMAGVRR